MFLILKPNHLALIRMQPFGTPWNSTLTTLIACGADVHPVINAIGMLPLTLKRSIVSLIVV